MGTKIKPRTLSEFMELMPDEQLVFNKIVSSIESIYRLYGFFPLNTPILESSDILLAKAGGETEKQIYRFTKGDSDLTMRFDLTVSLAKYVSIYYNELSFPFRRYQIGKVYRGERAQRGRFREFYQADIDIIGDGELAIINDAEIPSIIYEIFRKLGLTDFTIRINNRKILYGLFLMFSVQDSADEIMRIIDKIEKIGRDKAKTELAGIGISEIICEKIFQFISICGSNDEMIEQLRSFSNGNEIFESGINELECVIKAVSAFGVPAKNFRIDLSIARGLDYYTGTVYETTLNKYPEIGSICSGGRYDNLADFYSEKRLPGVGVSIGLTRLFYILNEMKYVCSENNPPIEVLVIPMTGKLEYAISFASFLRDNTVNTQIYLEDKKLKSKIGYANKMSVPFVAFIGEDEIKQNVVTLKNFVTGEQTTVDKNQALTIVQEFITQTRSVNVIRIPEE